MNTLVLLILALAAKEAVSLKVTVYYESLCPDSIRFITTQLYPTYQSLEFDVEFVPYGKATHLTNPWSIRCQHGSNECLGNAVQACALKRINSTDDQVNFVNCVMSTSYPPLYGQQCAESLGLNYTGVPSCSTGDEGRSIIEGLGDKTHSLQPPLSFVPTVIINDVYDDNIQNLALRNLPLAICTVDPQVPGCSLRFRKYRNMQREKAL